jgi:DNA-binding NarL/FixJ family response regulator
MHTERRTVLEMINAGASGYLLKDCAFEEVVQAVRTVAGNNTYLSPKIANIVIKDYVHRIPKSELSALFGLTTREREVLQLLSEGKKTKDVADVLRVSVKTAEAYRQHIMEKLNIYSIAELTKLAIREGLTSL